MEGVPQLGGDEDVLSLDQAILDGSSDTFAGLSLVLVVEGAVKQSVTVLDGSVDGVGGLVTGTFHRPNPTLGMDFPEASLKDMFNWCVWVDRLVVCVNCGSIECKKKR